MQEINEAMAELRERSERLRRVAVEAERYSYWDEYCLPSDVLDRLEDLQTGDLADDLGTDDRL